GLPETNLADLVAGFVQRTCVSQGLHRTVASWASGEIRRSEFQKAPAAAIGCQPDKRGGLAAPDGSTVALALAPNSRTAGRCWIGSCLDRDRLPLSFKALF